MVDNEVSHVNQSTKSTPKAFVSRLAKSQNRFSVFARSWRSKYSFDLRRWHLKPQCSLPS
jgi:hypothetical protein